MLLTTHYLEEADALADRVVVLDRGRVKASGAPAEVKRNAASRRVRCITSARRDQIDCPALACVSVPAATGLSHRKSSRPTPTASCLSCSFSTPRCTTSRSLVRVSKMRSCV